MPERHARTVDFPLPVAPITLLMGTLGHGSDGEEVRTQFAPLDPWGR